MPKRTHVEPKKAVRMLQANVTPSVIAQQFRCHARMIKHLRKRFWHIGTMSDRAHSWGHRLMTQRQDCWKHRFKLVTQFHPVTMIARTTPGTHNPRFSAQTETNRLREIGERPTYIQCMFYVRRFFFGLVYISWQFL